MLKVRTMFSGIGSPESALKNIGIDYDLVDFCEIDKFAIKSYCAIHDVDESKNLGDVSKVWGRDLPYADLLIWGFPCQDISVAGNLSGIKEGETRSGLYYEGFRILKETKPKYSVIENVKNLVGKRFKDDFKQMLEDIESLGYNNYWQVLNAKDYGIPQNRERVFIVSIREDVDNGTFEFPEPLDNGLRLKDLLEDEVEEKYYIDNKRVNELIERLKDDKKGTYPNVEDGPKVTSALSSREHRGSGWNDVVGTLCARDYKDPKVVAEPILIGGMQKNQSIKTDGISTCLTSSMGTGGGYVPMIVASRGRNPNNPSDRTVGSPTEQRLEPNSQGITNTLTTVQKDNLVLEPNNLKLFTNLKGGKWDKIHESARRVYDEEGIAPTIPTCGGGNIEPKVAVREATKKGYAIATVGDSIDLEQMGSKTRRGRVGKGVVNTLNTSDHKATLTSDYRIRKLTPKECWRLMGFTDEDYFKARTALEDKFYNGKDRSNSQMYKMAGNSIVTNVLAEIFIKLLGGYINE